MLLKVYKCILIKPMITTSILFHENIFNCFACEACTYCIGKGFYYMLSLKFDTRRKGEVTCHMAFYSSFI